jgi:hypothetical protein
MHGGSMGRMGKVKDATAFLRADFRSISHRSAHLLCYTRLEKKVKKRTGFFLSFL